MHEKGVAKMICKGIGPRAVGLFGELGVEILPGVTGKVDKVIEKYINGTLEIGTSSCGHTE